VVKLYQEFFTAARLVQFNRPIDSSQPAFPKTTVHTLSPDQNQEMKVIPLACELKLDHRLGTLVANQQTGGTMAAAPDWAASSNGTLEWSISGTLGNRPPANASPQNTDVLWDEFNVPIRLEVIEGAENIRLAARSDAGNGIESFTPVTLPIADLREYPSGFVLQSTGPGRVVIRASLVTKHGLRIVSTTEGLMGLLDLDVDSDNSGEIDGSLAEDEMEADPAQPGKLLVYTPSSGDAPGSPESWVEMSLKTISLRASDKVQFNYDDDQMTIWNSRPDQNPPADQRVVGRGVYTLTELGIVPGTPKTFYVSPGQECSGRQLISVHIIAANPSNGTSSDQVAVNLLPVEVVPDYNRDGKIDSADRGKVTTEKPFRWWINDDNDLTSAERGEGNQDIPTQSTSDRDCNDLAVDGMKDLIDFFPLHLDLKSALAVLPESEYKYVLKNADEALKFYEYPTCVVDGSEEGKEPNRHVKDVGTGRGLAAKSLKLASSQGSELSANMLTNLKEGRGVLVIEGAKKTTKPLILEILKKSDNSSIAKVDFPISITDVEEMYRHVNMRDVTGGSGGHATQTGEPSGYPDDLTNGKYVAFVHGYNVSGEYARGTQSNIFKRFHQLGSKARYVGVSWFGDPPNPGINLVLPPDYHQAVDNGLKSGIVARVRLGFTQGSSLTVLAHSLGNSLAGSAIANHGLEVEQYYIINGAIPLQAYDSLQTSNSSGHPDMKRNMTEDDWKPFYDHGNGEQQRLFASNWHELFAATPTDNRNKLTWKDIFAKPQLLSVAYNFYSPSDEVVENADETEEFGDWANLWDAGHGGRHAWVQQEIVKGGQHAVAASSFHDLNGGWRFNNNPTANTHLEAGYAKENLTGTGWRPYTVAEAAAEITDADLKLVPYHLPFLYHGLYDPAQGSSTAGVTTNRYKLLGSGIPATSYAIAANDLPKLNQVNGGEQRNFNMPQALRSPGGYSSWPEDENSNAPEDWMHSDFNDVALQFLHPMYQKMIDLAELDKN
jgi:hypothetical protein